MPLAVQFQQKKVAVTTFDSGDLSLDIALAISHLENGAITNPVRNLLQYQQALFGCYGTNGAIATK